MSAFLVFLVLNLIENWIHYNIGRNHIGNGTASTTTKDNKEQTSTKLSPSSSSSSSSTSSSTSSSDKPCACEGIVESNGGLFKNFSLYTPNSHDWIQIVVIMLIFGVLQGSMTVLLDKWIMKR